MQQANEEWRPVAEFELLYEVSSMGRVRSIRREKALSSQVSNSGYFYVHLWKSNKRHARFIHRLMARAFLPTYRDELQVNHLDGSKQHNRLHNFEMVTASENMTHAVRSLGLLTPIMFGVENSNSRPVLQLTLSGELVARFECHNDAVRSGGFDAACITECCNGTQKTHRGFLWRHADQVGEVVFKSKATGSRKKMTPRTPEHSAKVSAALKAFHANRRATQEHISGGKLYAAGRAA